MGRKMHSTSTLMTVGWQQLIRRPLFLLQFKPRLHRKLISPICAVITPVSTNSCRSTHSRNNVSETKPLPPPGGDDKNLHELLGSRDEFGSVYRRSVHRIHSAKSRPSARYRVPIHESLHAVSVPDSSRDSHVPSHADSAVNVSDVEVSSPDVERTLTRMNYVIDGVRWDAIEDDADDTFERKLREARVRIGKRNVSVYTFALKMKKLIRQKKLQAALDMFFNQMLLVDRVRPSYFCYNILIAGCGQYGHTKMAWKLFNDMKKRGYTPSKVTYTSLFNACANSLSRADAEHVLRRLRRLIAEKQYQMNAINYHALIKAYGRCGYIELAFGAADEMLEAGFSLTSDVINFLLQACISHKKEGFRFALQVWQRMRSESLAPMLCTYNLMLRSTVNCEAGETTHFLASLKALVPDLTVKGNIIVQQSQSRSTDAANCFKSQLSDDSSSSLTQEVIDPSSSLADEPIDSPSSLTQEVIDSPSSLTHEVIDLYSKPLSDDVIDDTIIESFSLNESSTDFPNHVQAADSDRAISQLSSTGNHSSLPNLLANRPTMGSILAINHLSSMEHRFAMLGSWRGVLSNMAADNLKPDIRTFSLLIHSLSRSDNHQELMSRMKQLSVQPDTGFYNQLIMAGARRYWQITAQQILAEMSERGVKPDIVTYGSLAWLVRSKRDLERYLAFLEEHDVRLSRQILQTLLKRAFKRVDIECIVKVLDAFVAHRIQPTRYTVEILEEFNEHLKKLQLDKDRGSSTTSHLPAIIGCADFDSVCERFRRRYRVWLRSAPLQHDPDPYEQYKVQPLVSSGDENSQ